MYEKGSEWRKWDLHVHTASSFDAYKGEDADELLVEAWKEKEFAAVAITDHFLIDSKRIKKLRELSGDITIFPGVELRTDKGSTNIHVILIFDDECDVELLEKDFEAIMLRQNAKAKESYETIYWDFEAIKSFAIQNGAIISLHAGKKDKGLDDQISNDTLFKMAIKEEFASIVDIFEVGKQKDIVGYKNYVFKDIPEKPLIICSDNHDPRDYQNKEWLWIKADTTFEGLRQTILMPSERVFVGDKPLKVDIVQKNKASYLSKISIKQTDNPKNSECWFNTNLDLNTGLVAIIGNKGSGKSALADILGLACNSKNIDHASFLDDNRFRKGPQFRANDYEVQIEWVDNKLDNCMNLGQKGRDSTVENAQYLPQRYIEKVCNDLDNEFQTEINKVIFTYIDDVDKSNTTSLDSLISYKARGQNMIIEGSKQRLSQLNSEVIEIENKLKDSYKVDITDRLRKKQDDLKRHDENKPKEVKKPENVANNIVAEELQRIDSLIEEKKNEIDKKRDKLKEINTYIDDLKNLSQRIYLAKVELDEINKEVFELMPEPLKENSKIKYEFPDEIIKQEELRVVSERNGLMNLLQGAGLETSLSQQLDDLKKKRNELVESSNAEEKKYQIYITNLKEWEEVRNTIIGNKEIQGSLISLTEELRYINDDLKNEYKGKVESRKALIGEIYKEKFKITDIYKELYSPIEKEIGLLLDNVEDKIEFDVDMVLKNKDLGTDLLTYINNSMKGIFQGRTESSVKIATLINNVDFNDFISVYTFIEAVLSCISEDFEVADKKVKARLEFYNLITNMDFLGAEFCLKMGGRKLSELSPGERGIVLLVFYLALSKEKIPLIIDQPEDNLDNQSVFDKLVPCIISAKTKRQVVIVTHNPNIAVACDAEQIICSSMDKARNEISYKSGSIENENIRKSVIDVLEGTLPAFDLRKRKYNLELNSSVNK